MRTPVWVAPGMEYLLEMAEEVEPGWRKGVVRFPRCAAQFHLDAYEVGDFGGAQVGMSVLAEAGLAELYEMVNPDRPFETVEWNGRKWVVVIYPFAG